MRGGGHKRAVEHNVELCTRVLAGRMMKGDWERSRRVAERLASYKQHSAAVTIDDLEELGLNVREARGRRENYYGGCTSSGWTTLWRWRS
jgi:hypothetical protein